MLYLSAAAANGGYATKRKLLRSHFVGPYAYFEVTKTDAGAAIAFGAIGAAASARTYGVALESSTGNVMLLDKMTLMKITEEHKDLRNLLGPNWRRDPAGSKAIVKALNDRLISAG